MVDRLEELSDGELLARTGSEVEAFAVFYRRHVDWVLRVSARRTRSAEHAADLTAEVFAAALLSAGRFSPERAEPNKWLFGIFLKKLAGFERRGRSSGAAGDGWGSANRCSRLRSSIDSSARNLTPRPSLGCWSNCRRRSATRSVPA